MTKIKKLSFVFVGLAVVSLLLMWMGKKERIVHVDKDLFAIADTTQISGLTIGSKDQVIDIERKESNWQINDRYKADPQLIYLAQRILNAVQTQRPVGKSNFETIKNHLVESGIKVQVYFSDGDQRVFYAGGNTAKTTAYFANEGLTKIYTVAIPGYKSYLSGIFELSLNQWRDRVLFESDWRTIQQLEINYADENLTDLRIAFEDKFLAVAGVNSLDTAALMEYLHPLEFFQLNDYLTPGSFPRYDSLKDSAPIATLEVRDIDADNNRSLKVYPKILGERFYLVTDAAGEMIVVDEGRMENLLAQPQQFQTN